MFEVFSSHTEWFFAVLSLLGVSLVAVLRAVFGKTKLEFEFCVINNEDSQSLICDLKNSPFRNWVMKLLFVQRPRIDDISVRCEVLDRSLTMQKIGTAFLADMVTVDGKIVKQLSLPASILPVKLSIIRFDNETKVASLLDTKDKGTPLLDSVLYLVRVAALLGDKRVKSHLAGCIIKDEIKLLKLLPESIVQGVDYVV
jgi:hypothetical protein